MTTPRMLLLALAASLSGCLEELPDVARIDELRVLAITAEPPEVGAGGTTTLEALVVDADQRPIALEWKACTIPDRDAGFFSGGQDTSSSGGGGYGLEDRDSCAAAVEAGEPGAFDLGTGPTATLEVPEDFLDDTDRLYEIYGIPEGTEIPEALLAGFLSVSGVNITVSVRATAGDDVVDSFKRVNVSTNPTPNENPPDIAFDLLASDSSDEPRTTGDPPPGRLCFLDEAPDKPLVVERGKSYRFMPVNVPDPQPSYQVIIGTTDLNQPFTVETTDEIWFLSGFSTSGSFDKGLIKTDGTLGLVFTVDSEPRDAPVPVWIVVRDGRGGTAWCHSLLQLAP